MKDPLIVIPVTIALIVLSGFFVIMEFALLGARRHRLEAEAATSRSARAALRGMNQLTMMLAGAQLGITACTFALGAITKPAMDAWMAPMLVDIGIPRVIAGGSSFALSLLFVTFLHLVVGEMAPKSWAIAHPERAAKVVSPIAHLFVWLVRPLLAGLNTLANRLVAASGVTPVYAAAAGGYDADTLRQLVEHSAETGMLEDAMQTQIRDVIDLEHLTAGELVPPGQQVTAVGSGASIGDVQDAASVSGHMRIVMVAANGEVVGLVHVRDTLVHRRDEPAQPLARLPFVLSPETPVNEALRRMRREGEQLAIIANADRTLGVVSMTDIMHRVLPSNGNGPALDNAA